MKRSIYVDNTYAGMRIDRFLRNYFNRMPQSYIERSLRSGIIKLNKKKTKSSNKLQINDLIEIYNLKFVSEKIEKNTKSYKSYKKKLISERHRHRYEFNNSYSDRIFDDKFIVAGSNPDTKLVEIVENIDHPWFVGVQFHPEYKSSVYKPHPIFVNFVKASLKKYLNK